MPPQNLIGFGVGDFIELALAVLLFVLALVSRRWIEPFARKLAPKTGWCMLFLALLPVALRLAMLPQHPVPAPTVYDEFGHLLVADTLLHFRLATPPHPLHQFFETFFVLQTPAYASIYPIGQGLALAVGRAIFGLPWAGVLLSTAAMCALCYWMLRGWTTPTWALAGGVLAVIEFGPLNQWMNSYWGGSVAAIAGCLAFGALPRLREGARARYGAVLGLGIGLHWLTRPYETIFLVASVLIFLAPRWRALAEPALAAALVLLPVIALSLDHNQRTTGNWSTLPYSLSRHQYGVPAAFTWQSQPQPHLELTPEQQMQYKMQNSFRSNGQENVRGYLLRLVYRVRFYRFFFLAPLYVALPFFFANLRQLRCLWLALTLLLFALGVNFYPFFEAHYLGALTCLFVLVSVTALARLNPDVARLILWLCLAHFLFFYGRTFMDRSPTDRREIVNQQLVQSPGKQLVFVRYWPQHIFQDEWVYNAADIDHARVIWARDLGAEDQMLLRYYPERTAWLLEPDAKPPKLTRYHTEVEQQKIQPPAPITKSPADHKPPLRFEQVH
ncbi:MAG TPA: hypothetical protein VK686_23245 [Bryobacteraceae bacterium]|nr:hypothetical protein [Bryobacteraceae bacterium]